MDLQKYSHGKKNKIDHPSSPSPSHPSPSHPSSPSSSTPSVNYTPISLFSTPASSQESQYSTILPQTLEEDYPIEEDPAPAPTLDSVNETPILLCQPCVEEESSIDSQIIDNIVRFLSNETKKVDQTVSSTRSQKMPYLPLVYSHNQLVLKKYERGYPSTKTISINSRKTMTTNATFNPTIFNYQITTNTLLRH